MKTPSVLALCVALAACVAGGDRSGASGQPGKVFQGVPFPRDARLVDTALTPEAARVEFAVDAPSPLVLAFYRRELPKAGFRVIGDVGDSVEAVLYAQRDGPPLWVQVHRGPLPGTTRLTMIAAKGAPSVRRDSAAAPGARPPAPR